MVKNSTFIAGLGQLNHQVKVMCGGGSSSSDQYAAQARADEVARQGRIKEGMGAINQNFSGFDKQFYNKRAQDYVNYANPQASDQYRQNTEQLAYNLARSGLTDSSERSRSQGVLQKAYDTAKASIASQGQNVANQAMSSVEQSRGNLVNQLYATGDAQNAANQAINSAGMLAQSQAFSPLGNLFANVTGIVGNAATAGYYDKNAQGLNGFKNTWGLQSTKEKVGT
jgi:hypothetical protein